MSYNEEFALRTWSVDGKKTMDATPLVQSLRWSGSWRDCARQLSLSALPQALAELGGAVQLTLGGENRFSGRIMDRQRDSLGQTLELTALDNGHYLKKNSTYRAVRNQTPEAVTRELCGQYGIPAGRLAATGVKLSRNFLGSSLYQVIQTMYTLAGEQNGKKYQIRFRGNSLEVAEKALGTESLRLVPGSNLLSCQSRDSIQDMVNSVAVYSDEYQRIQTYSSPEGFAALYENGPASGGTDPESDEALLARYRERIRRIATSGNPYQYQLWATSVDGVTAARTIAKWDGPGTVKVVLAGAGMEPPGEAVVAACDAYIQEQRPVGPAVTVAAAGVRELAVAATVTIDGTTTKAAVRDALEQAVRNYISGLARDAFAANIDLQVDTMEGKGYTVLYNRIAFLLLAIPGVLDYSALTVGGGTANIQVDADKLPVLTGVTVS